MAPTDITTHRRPFAFVRPVLANGIRQTQALIRQFVPASPVAGAYRPIAVATLPCGAKAGDSLILIPMLPQPGDALVEIVPSRWQPCGAGPLPVQQALLQHRTFNGVQRRPGSVL